MLQGFYDDSKCTAYTEDSARGLIVIRTHLGLSSGKLVLQKNFAKRTYIDSNTEFFRSQVITIISHRFAVILDQFPNTSPKIQL